MSDDFFSYEVLRSLETRPLETAKQLKEREAEEAIRREVEDAMDEELERTAPAQAEYSGKLAVYMAALDVLKRTLAEDEEDSP